MNFCVAILTLKVEENVQHFQHIILYYFKKGKNATETQKKMCSGYGDGAVTEQTCHRWFARCRTGGVSLDDAAQSGRPVEVDGDQIETFTENGRRHATWGTADILTISKSVKSLVKMKNVSFILQKKHNRLFGQPNRN